MVDICAWVLFLLIICSHDSAHGITLMIQKWLDELREI